MLLIEPVWTGPYVAYLAWKELPEDPMVARQIVRRSKSFTLINGELYKRSKSGVLQRCIAPEDEKASYETYMVEPADIMRAARQSSAKPSDLDFTDLQPLKTPRSSCEDARHANASQRSHTRLPQSST